MYENGLGVNKNQQKALTMYLIAARAGSSAAQEKVKSLQSDLTLDEYQTAVHQADDMIAYIRVPGFYDPDLKGRHQANAKRERDRAALYKDLDQVSTQTDQSMDHSHYIRAAEQYQKAIESGYFGSARNLGMMYEKGYGFSKNPQMALTYYYLGAMGGAKSAELSAQKLSAKMAAADIELAKKDAETLYKKYALSPPIIPPRKPYRFVADAKTQFLAEDNLDLGTRSAESETSFLADARLGVYFYPSETITTYLEGRAITNTGLASSDNEDSNDTADSTYGELRQAWVEFDRIFGNPLLSIKAGRQRFYEERAVMWNRDVDALRLNLDSTLTSGFLAVGHNFNNYRIGDNDEFLGAEKERLRFLGEVSRKLSMDHTLEARFLYENDYSDAENTGSIVSPEDRDNEDAQLLWGNIRLKGEFKTPDTFFSGLEYRLDGLMVTGEETVINSSAIANTANRLVTGQVDRNVMGWGMDTAVVLHMDAPLSPSLTFGYAFGSGDDDTTGRGDNHAFRQTDLEGNSSRRPNAESSFASRNYGEVLRPELSNIHVLQTGVSIPVLNASQINLTYFNYHLDEENSGLRSSGINAPLNGTDSYLGQAVDVELNVDMDETFHLTQPLLTQSSSRVRLGVFQAGEAFGAAEDEYAFRGTLEFRIKF
jgi:TPR repeat protein